MLRNVHRKRLNARNLSESQENMQRFETLVADPPLLPLNVPPPPSPFILTPSQSSSCLPLTTAKAPASSAVVQSFGLVRQRTLSSSTADRQPRPLTHLLDASVRCSDSAFLVDFITNLRLLSLYLSTSTSATSMASRNLLNLTHLESGPTVVAEHLSPSEPPPFSLCSCIAIWTVALVIQPCFTHAHPFVATPLFFSTCSPLPSPPASPRTVSLYFSFANPHLFN
jgi:hypothetical protein